MVWLCMLIFSLPSWTGTFFPVDASFAAIFSSGKYGTKEAFERRRISLIRLRGLKINISTL